MIRAKLRERSRLTVNVTALLLAFLWKAQPAAPSPAERSPGGKIIAVSGDVGVLVEGKEPAREALPSSVLFVGDVVRTGDPGRAALLLLDGSQIKLNSNTTLEIQSVAASSSLVGIEKASAYERATGTLIRLIRGESWVRARGAEGRLKIDTPVASATIRGTELDIAFTDRAEAVTTVVEGLVELANSLGQVVIAPGERGRAKAGEPPTKEIVLTPEDAVQWSLYYPAEVSLKDMPLPESASVEARRAWDAIASKDHEGSLAGLRAVHQPDEPADLAQAVALQGMGRTAEARKFLEQEALPRHPASSRLLSRLAQIELLSGEAASARARLEEALRSNATDWVPHNLLATIALTQNRKDDALAEARRAVELNPAVPSTHVALGLALQSRFDLDGARAELEKAVAADPKDVPALLNLARVLFGQGLTGPALDRLNEARAIEPGEPLVLALLGFVELARGETTEAEASFRKAAAVPGSVLAEPYLGLGLCAFRQGNAADGLLSMLSATLIDPRVSLYQSYLGKAYYEVRDFKLAFKALEEAIALDPRDPTPHLYSGLILRENYRPVDALEEFRASAALNNNRAVYRSRSLLDRDLATRNVSQAQSYRDIGFEAWGASRAVRGVEGDPTSSGAHLFLVGNYLGLPDRTSAAGSELIQTQLLLPVNENTFNTFSDYTSFFEGPRNRFILTGTGGDYSTGILDAAAQGGMGPFSYNAIASFTHRDGYRDVENPLLQGQLQAFTKYAIGPTSSLLLDAAAVRDSSGLVSGQETRALTNPKTGLSTAALWLNPPDLDLDQVTSISSVRAQIGGQYQRYPWSEALVLLSGSNYEQQNDDIIPSSERGSGRSEARSWFREQAVALQGHYGINLRGHHLFLGTDMRYAANDLTDAFASFDAARGKVVVDRVSHQGETRLFSAYVGDGWDATDWLYLVGGGRLDLFENFFPGAGLDQDKQVVKPFAGARISLGSSTWLRGAYIEALETQIDAQRLEPAQVAGFPLYLSQFQGAERREFDLSLEREIGDRAFVTFFGTERSLDTPVFFQPQEQGAELRLVNTEEQFWSGGGQWNQILTDRVPWLDGALTLTAEGRYEHGETEAFDVENQLYSLALHLVHPSGWFVHFTNRYMRQNFLQTSLELPEADPILMDLSVSRELWWKRLRISAEVTNLLDQHFEMILGGFSIVDLEPVRNFRVSMRATF